MEEGKPISLKRIKDHKEGRLIFYIETAFLFSERI